MTTFDKRLKHGQETAEHDQDWQHWVIGCAAGMAYLILISWLG